MPIAVAARYPDWPRANARIRDAGEMAQSLGRHGLPPIGPWRRTAP